MTNVAWLRLHREDSLSKTATPTYCGLLSMGVVSQRIIIKFIDAITQLQIKMLALAGTVESS